MKNQSFNSSPSQAEQETNLLERNLTLTPEQRLLNHQKALNLLKELQKLRKGSDGKRS
jgi:hypothetical protein